MLKCIRFDNHMRKIKAVDRQLLKLQCDVRLFNRQNKYAVGYSDRRTGFRKERERKKTHRGYHDGYYSGRKCVFVILFIFWGVQMYKQNEERKKMNGQFL